MLPILAGIVNSLISNNLGKVADAVTSKGLDYVEEKLGVKLEPDMSSEKLAAIKEAAMKHEEFMVEQENKDRADARNMNVKLQESANASWMAKNTAYVIDYIIVISAMLVTYILFLKGVPTENKELAYTAFGSLWTLVGTVVNFHRSSSAGSKAKSDELMKAIK